MPMEGVAHGNETPKVRSKRSRSGSSNTDLRELMMMMREMKDEIKQLKDQRSTTGQPYLGTGVGSAMGSGAMGSTDVPRPVQPASASFVCLYKQKLLRYGWGERKRQ